MLYAGQRDETNAPRVTTEATAKDLRGGAEETVDHERNQEAEVGDEAQDIGLPSGKLEGDDQSGEANDGTDDVGHADPAHKDNEVVAQEQADDMKKDSALDLAEDTDLRQPDTGDTDDQGDGDEKEFTGDEEGTELKEGKVFGLFLSGSWICASNQLGIVLAF